MDCCEAWHTVNEINATKWKYRHFQIWSVTWEKWTHIANGVIFGKWKTLPVFALKKKCHRKFFMSAKIIGKKPVSSSPPCVRLNLGLILIQHTLWVFMTNRSTSWKKKKKRHVHSCLLTVTARCAGRYTCQAAHWQSALSALWQFMISQSFEISSSWHKWWQCTFSHSGYLTCAELMRTHTPYDMTDETYQS